MAKRSYGSGTVRQRKDGRWEAQLRLPDGRRRSLYARTRAQLLTRLREERWRSACGLPRSPAGLTLAAYLEQWLQVAAGRLRPKTLDSYRLCASRLEAELGAVPMRRLTPQLIQRAELRLLAGGASRRTVFQTHAVLHRALEQARHWALVQTNASELVTPPRPVQREMRALTSRELEILLRSSAGSRWYPLWVLLGTAGLRIGEAVGLKWSDVDLIAGRLQIRRALQRQRRRGLVFVHPKSERSRRCIHLSLVAVEALRVQRARVASELVFPNRHGEPREASSVTAALSVALGKASLPAIRVHDLRHTAASVLLEAGTHPKVVQDLLGHSTAALTLNTYSHVTPGLSDEAARVMDRVLGRPAAILSDDTVQRNGG